MKQSQYVVAQKGDAPGTVLIYSTFSTSMVELEEDIYNDIFIESKYELHPDEVSSLFGMGFLIDDNYDEFKYLESLRIKTLEANASSPSYYIICPTTGCNARCPYCFEKGAKQKRMNKETAMAVASYIVKNHDENHLMIQWFGGEPLLEPETISFIVNILHENNVNFDSKIITNGYCLNGDIIQEAVINWNVKVIQITIDAVGEEYNSIKNYINPRSDPFETVMGNIKKCLVNGIDVRIRINFNPLEYERAVRTVEYLKMQFIEYSNFYVYLAPIDSEDIPSITNTFSEKNKHPLIELLDAEEDFCSFGNYDNRNAKKENNYESILRKYYLTPIPTSCYGGCESSLTIDSMGNIFDCHRLLGNEEYASGNVFTGRIKNEISEYYSNPYITDEECVKCNLLPLCHGGCKYRAFKYGKDHACTSIKGAVKELIHRVAYELNCD